jgi:hypothetical protein
MEPTPNRPDSAGTPLAAVAGLSSELRARLEGRWLRSAEDVLAAAVPPGAGEALRQFLELSEADYAGLLAQLRAVVPPEARYRLEHPPVRRGGLGLRLPGASPVPPSDPSLHEPDPT